MHGRRISALGLVTLAVVSNAGCSPPTCAPGDYGPYDNRDRTNFPSVDQDWVCVAEPEPVTPPVPPNLGSGQKLPDPKGPKDLRAVAIASIFVESCIHDLVESSFNINERIDARYGAIVKSRLEKAIDDRISCLSNSEYGLGCDRVRRCIGLLTLPDEPTFQEGCHQGTFMHRREDASGILFNDWGACNAIELVCMIDPIPHCGGYQSDCDPNASTPFCKLDAAMVCEYEPETNRYVEKSTTPSCFLHGLSCTVENNSAFCVGAGNTCTVQYQSSDHVAIDFRSGIVCDDENTLRTCVNGREATRDCSEIAKGLKCIGGSRPHCATDFQCDYEGLHPIPTCDGTRINVCNAGAPMTVDCADLGFETCDAVRGTCKPYAPTGAR